MVSFECNPMYVEDVEDRSNTPKAVMLCMSKMSKMGKEQILCILKHVEDVEDNLRHLRHASTYIGSDGMVGKLSVSTFQNFFRIENPLIIKEVMSQNVSVCSFPIFDIFDIFDIHSITALGVFDLSSTSSTYIGLHSNDTILRKV